MPTQEQLAILGCKSPVVIIEAAAGTGKTSTLALLAGQALGKGIDPRRILVLTKTDAAIDAMRFALKRIGLSSSQIKAMQIETIEKFSRRILMAFESGSVPLLDSLNDLATPAWTAMMRMIETTPSTIKEDFRIPSNAGKSRDDDWIEDFFMLSRRFKGGLQFLDEEGSFSRTAEIANDPDVVDLHAALWFRDYVRHVRCAGFGDEPPAFRSEGDASYDLARYRLGGYIPPGSPAVPANFSLVLLDEMHDLNAAAYEVVKLLMSENRADRCQFVGVGDRHQVIYEYDAADDRFMNTDVLESDLKRPVKSFGLALTFRFGQELSQAVNRIFPGKCQSRQDSATSVELANYKNTPSGMDQSLLDVLKRYKNNKTGDSSLAIVLRHPYQSFAIENTLIGEGLPYEVSGLVSCFDWPEIMLIRGIVAVGGQRVTDAAGSEKVRRGIIRAFDEFARPSYSESALFEAGARSREAFVQMAMQSAAASEQVIRAFMNGTLLKSGYCEQVVVRRLTAAIGKVELKGQQVTVAEIAGALEIERLLANAFVSVRRRKEALANLETLKAAAEQHGSVAAFFQYLNLQEKKREDIDQKNQAQKQLAHRQSALRRQQTAISLFNVDMVKGLEFSDVYLPCANRGEFPAYSAPAKEERNRFYVALSRAKERLTVSARSGHENDWFLAQKNAA
ncbi:MAG: ATP-dependent helicase UvrD/PcrA [Polaromonas sp.]|nr:ATP-dependent helicase UvrD/PcrA [Polaromonas sp.]